METGEKKLGWITEQCVKRTAKHLFSDQLNHIDFLIPENLSNAILNELNFSTETISPETIKHIVGRLQASKFKSLQLLQMRNHCKLVRTQNLRILEIVSPDAFVFFREDDGVERGFNEPWPVNILRLLYQILNKRSRRSLEVLRIDGWQVRFWRGWMKELAPQLPSLQRLDISDCLLEPADFSAICAYNINLEKLNLSRTGITDLTGISNLGKLKNLILTDLNIANQTSMDEIFELTKLEVLDISGVSHEGLLNANKFWASGKVLPNLQFLDISRNFLNETEALSIIGKHPTLKAIGLIDVAGETIASAPDANAGLKILNIETLQNSLDALKHYSQKYYTCPPRVWWIIHLAGSHLVLNYVEQFQEVIHKFVDTALKFAKRQARNAYLDSSVAGFLGACSINKFTFTELERQSIADYLLSIIGTEWESQNPADPCWQIQISCWTILQDPLILQSVTNLYWVCDNAILLIMRTSRPGEAFIKALSVVSAAIAILESQGLHYATLQELASHQRVPFTLLDFLNRHDRHDAGMDDALFVTFLFQYYDSHFCLIYVNTILNLMERTFRHHCCDVAPMLRKLAECKYMRPSVERELWKLRTINMYLEFIELSCTREATINLLAYLFKGRLKRYASTTTAQLTASIMQSYSKMEDVKDTDKLEVFKRIRSSEETEGVVVEWANWFLALFERPPEQRRKPHDPRNL